MRIEVAIPPAAVSIAFSDVEKKNLFNFLIWRVFAENYKKAFQHQKSSKSPNQTIKKAFQRQRRRGLPGCLIDMKLTFTNALQSTYHCRGNKCYLHGCRVNYLLSTRLPIEQVLIYPAAGRAA